MSNECQTEIYADGIGKLHFVGGMVRYDFVTLQPNPDGSGDPIPEYKERIIMPPQGFLRMFDSMQSLIDNLVKAGVLAKNENAGK